MVKTFTGHKNVSDKQFAIVVAQFNEFITKNLLEACINTLKDHGVADDAIIVAWVPGAFEIPVIAQALARRDDIDAVICLGCVIKGETYHFESVVNESTRGIGEVALKNNKPIIYEVLAVTDVDLARARAQSDGDNKGADAAEAAINMVTLLEQI